MLQIPSVTQDDLSAFHVRVFGPTLAPRQVVETEPRPDDEAIQMTTLDIGDDLGYYPDGNKRTLTDDQIAMFRHSEIYAILRERQVRKENKEADGDDQIDDPASRDAASPEDLRLHKIEADPDEERPRHYPYESSSGDLQTAARTLMARNKRKRDLEDAGDKLGKASTRRIVRELDSARAEDQVLDYGDELAETHSSTETLPDKAVTDVVGDGKVPSVPGKKIWWPTIETC